MCKLGSTDLNRCCLYRLPEGLLIKLLHRLERFGTTVQPLSLFQSHLTDRQQFVEIECFPPPPFTRFSGIPQGSNLGPVFFKFVYMI